MCGHEKTAMSAVVRPVTGPPSPCARKLGREGIVRWGGGGVKGMPSRRCSALPGSDVLRCAVKGGDVSLFVPCDKRG